MSVSTSDDISLSSLSFFSNSAAAIAASVFWTNVPSRSVFAFSSSAFADAAIAIFAVGSNCGPITSVLLSFKDWTSPAPSLSSSSVFLFASAVVGSVDGVGCGGGGVCGGVCGGVGCGGGGVGCGGGGVCGGGVGSGAGCNVDTGLAPAAASAAAAAAAAPAL